MRKVEDACEYDFSTFHGLTFHCLALLDSFLFPRRLLQCRSGGGEERSGEKSSALIQIRFVMVGFALWVYETLVVRFCGLRCVA